MFALPKRLMNQLKLVEKKGVKKCIYCAYSLPLISWPSHIYQGQNAALQKSHWKKVGFVCLEFGPQLVRGFQNANLYSAKSVLSFPFKCYWKQADWYLLKRYIKKSNGGTRKEQTLCYPVIQKCDHANQSIAGSWQWFVTTHLIQIPCKCHWKQANWYLPKRYNKGAQTKSPETRLKEQEWGLVKKSWYNCRISGADHYNK